MLSFSLYVCSVQKFLYWCISCFFQLLICACSCTVNRSVCAMSRWPSSQPSWGQGNGDRLSPEVACVVWEEHADWKCSWSRLTSCLQTPGQFVLQELSNCWQGKCSSQPFTYAIVLYCSMVYAMVLCLLVCPSREYGSLYLHCTELAEVLSWFLHSELGKKFAATSFGQPLSTVYYTELPPLCTHDRQDGERHTHFPYGCI